MSWANIPILGLENWQGTIASGSSKFTNVPSNYYVRYPDDLSNSPYLDGDGFAALLGTEGWLFGDSNAGVYIRHSSSRRNFDFYVNGSVVLTQFIIPSTGTRYQYTIYCAVDDSNNVGTIFIYRNDTTGGSSGSRDIRYFSDSNIYTILTANPIVNYHWQSVPAISGKNGILSLGQLASDTDGNPVSGASSSIFFSAPNDSTRLDRLVQKAYGYEQIAGYSGENYFTVTWNNATSVTVKYYWEDNPNLEFASWTYTLSNSSDYIYPALLIDASVDGVRPSFFIYDSVNGTWSYNTESGTDDYIEALRNWLVINYNGNSIFGDPNGPAGGDENSVVNDDPIDTPVLPTTSALDTGFTRMYWVDDVAKLRSLHSWLSDPDLQITNVLFKEDPAQALIGISISGVEIPHSNSANIHFLGVDTEVAAANITDQFWDVDCGDYTFEYKMGHTFLDYSPYTKIKLMLPFIGTLELNTDDVMGKKINLQYRFDCYSGICVAFVYVYTTNGKSLHYTKEGRFMIDMPFTKTDFNRMAQAVKTGVESLLSFGAAAGANSMAGNGGLAVAGMAYHMIHSAGNVMTSKRDLQYIGGSTNGVSGYMGLDKPYIMIEIPILARPENDQLFIGMPSYITDTIGSFGDYAIFKSVHLDDILCTDKEKKEIERILLNDGVHIRNGSDTPDVSTSDPDAYAIVFLKNRSENNTIGKTFDSPMKLEGKLVFDQSIENPKILINGSVVGYNYAYIPYFQRFYYIDDSIITRSTMQEVSLSVDVLQSFKDSIMDCEGVASRSSDNDKINYLINDGAITVQDNSMVYTQKFTKDGVKFGFSRGSTGYVLIVAS